MDEIEESCCGMNREEWGWLLLGSGAVGIVALLFRRNRWLQDWLLPLGLTGGGLALLLQERGHGIDRAEERVAAELETLDPIARAQVLKRVAARELGLTDDDEAFDDA